MASATQVINLVVAVQPGDIGINPADSVTYNQIPMNGPISQRVIQRQNALIHDRVAGMCVWRASSIKQRAGPAFGKHARPSNTASESSQPAVADSQSRSAEKKHRSVES